MERRLLKDFQIGIVEGIVQDVISSDQHEPKDVFSQIAKAIGSRASSGRFDQYTIIYYYVQMI